MNQYEKIGEPSGYADIFKVNEKTVLKAFRKKCFNIPDYDLIIRAICDLEVKAYQILVNNSEIKEYIPEFYGKQDPISFLNVGENVYVENAGFIIELIEGKDYKIGQLYSHEKINVQPILDLMDSALATIGVCTVDANCFYQSANNFKLIDFAYKNFDNYLNDLKEKGCLSEIHKKELEKFII